MFNRKGTITRLIAKKIDKKKHSINEWIFCRAKVSGWRVKVESNLSHYARKTDLKNAAWVDTSSFAKKTDLANLKYNSDKLDVDKLENVPTNLSNMESKVDKLDVDKLVSVPVD